MPHNQALAMTVATRKNFHLLAWIAFMLIFIAALNSSHSLMVLLLAFGFLLAALRFPAILFAGVSSESRSVHIAKDGQVSFTSIHGEATEGQLDGSQWCTRHLAVLRCRSDNVVRHVVLIAARQSPESFRQLCVWLRHNHSKEGRDQS